MNTKAWTVAICVDSSRLIGSGHLIRCVSLAKALKQAGATVRFYYAPWPQHHHVWLNSQSFHGELLDFDVERFNQELFQNKSKVLEFQNTKPWPPLWQKRYGLACIKAWQPWLCGIGAKIYNWDSISNHETFNSQIDWCIYDNYGLSTDFVATIRSSCRFVMAIDDLANRPHFVDILLDQNAVKDMYHRYTSLVSASCFKLLGPSYALIRPEFYESIPERGDRQVNRVLISIGGSDTKNLTERTLKLFTQNPQFEYLQLDIVVGSAYEKIAELKELSKARPHTALHIQTNDMAALMRQADIAIGAGGSSQWERALTKLPSIVIAVAENQIPGCLYLQAQETILFLGMADTLTDEALLEAIHQLIDNKELRKNMAERAYSIMLGDSKETQINHNFHDKKYIRPQTGAEKVSGQLRFLSTLSTLELRQARYEDAELLFTWANDPHVRAMAFNKEPIPWQSHLSWFSQKRQDTNTDIWICSQFGKAIGQCRLNSVDNKTGEIHINLNPEFRGIGLSAPMIAKACILSAERHNWKEIRAVVKLSNHPSLRAFIRAGFEPTKQEICFGEESQWFSLNSIVLAKIQECQKLSLSTVASSATGNQPISSLNFQQTIKAIYKSPSTPLAWQKRKAPMR